MVRQQYLRVLLWSIVNLRLICSSHNLTLRSGVLLLRQSLNWGQMFCGKCAFANPDTNRFCVSCGGPIQIAESAVGSASQFQIAQPVTAPQQPMQTGGSSSLAPRKMSFVDAIKYCLTNYANFKGRAARSEYWLFYLFAILVYFVAALVAPALYILVILGLFVPSIAALTRRLHDTGRQGATALFLLIPLVGAILVLVWLCTEGDKTPNNFGPPW